MRRGHSYALLGLDPRAARVCILTLASAVMQLNKRQHCDQVEGHGSPPEASRLHCQWNFAAKEYMLPCPH